MDEIDIRLKRPGINISFETGLSAYEIAVKNGFSGSQKEWLTSLQGKTVDILGYYDSLELLQKNVPNPGAGDTYGVGTAPPYQIYVFDGVSGNWKNNGAIQGPIGKSAYEIAVDNGFSGSEDDWLDSLKEPAYEAYDDVVDILMKINNEQL